jgi:hypothetical protein
MPFWPFFRREPESLSPDELRTALIDAATSGSRRKLRSVCRRYKSQVARHLDVIAKMPDGMPTDDAAVDRYVQCLGAVAQCLARDCGAPELWNRLCGDANDNPLVVWDRWEQFIERAKALRGAAARLNEAFLYGRLGELYFHSGRATDAIAPFQSALALCREIRDFEGECTYLGNPRRANVGPRETHSATAQRRALVPRRVRPRRRRTRTGVG